MNMNSRLRRRRGAGCCAAAIALCVVAATPTAAGARPTPAGHDRTSASPVVAISDGALRGRTTGTTDEFRGIPYAAAPVGPLRWRAPQPAARWRGVRDATRFAPHCAQPQSPFGVESSSEDCLYLNVAAPHGRRHRGDRPVLVWIHGGGYRLGESQDYDPTKLAADGTVVVTINYRLGALGFLAHPAFADRPGDSSGNYGLMDQQAALRWVKRNIGKFGGDPRNVTIAGESAGGLAVLSHLASRGARGLFHRAIVQSGDFALTQTPLPVAEAEGESFAVKVGCADQSADCLRDVPVSAILANQRDNPTGYTPGIVDGKVLEQSIGTVLASGKFNRVPIINGTNRDEWRLFVALEELISGTPVTAANYQARITSTLGVPADVAAVIANEYPLSAFASPSVALGAVGTDAIFACSALQANQWTSKYVPTYVYEFNDDTAPQPYLPPVSFPYGAAHQAELQYLFGLRNVLFPTTLSEQQEKLAAGMRGYWASFAKRGVPSAADQPRWPRFDSHDQRMISLELPRPHVETDFAAEHHCGFWGSAG